MSGVRRVWGRVRNEPGLGRNVAGLVAVIVLALGVGGYILSHQQANWPWQSRFMFSADFQASPGVTPGQGQEVRIAGVRVGDIRDVEVSPNGRAARVTMALEPGHPIYNNARLILRPKSPLNEMYVEINPGGPPGKPVADESVLPEGNTQRPIQPDEVLGHLDDRSRAALTSLLSESDVALVRAPDSLPPGLKATDRLATQMRPVAQALQARRAAISQLVTSLSQISTASGKDDVRLTQLSDSMRHTLDAVGGRDRDLNAALAQMPGLSNDLQHASAGVQQLSGQLDPTLRDVRQASGKLPSALDRLNGTVGQVDKTVDAAKPVVRQARPVLADLRPFVNDANASLGDVRSVTQRLDPATAALVPYLTDLRAFVYNTNSVTSLQDANGGILRGLFEVSPSTLPVPNTAPGH